MARLEAEGHILQGSTKSFAQSGIAISVRAGAKWPDIGDDDSVRRTVRAARTIGYSTGPSGDHLLQLFEQWGLLPTAAERLIQAPPGVPVGSLVARGEAEIGFQQLSELIRVPGIDVVGPLPPEIQCMTVFAAGVGSASPNVAATRDFIAYLTSSAADRVKREQGMEPVRLVA